MSSNRREFLRQAVAVAAGVGANGLPLTAQSVATMPTSRASTFMTLFGLKYPISNAGMGASALPELTIAVANAGGLGHSERE